MKSFAASLVVHIAIVAAIITLNFSSEVSKPNSVERLPQERRIEISFIAENIPELVSSSKKNILKPVQESPKEIEKKTEQKQTSVKPAQKQITASKKQIGTDDYKAQVRTWLEQYKTYPRRAKIARMQGEAMVSFTIAADGQLLASHLTSSSGHEILDYATMQAVRKASPFPQFPADLPKDNLNISVPFAYYVE